MMPRWIAQRLIEDGTLDHAGRGRRARQQWCRRCGLVVIEGYDADICARLITADPTPLSPLGEALTLVTGRYTTTLWDRGGRLEFGSRAALQILSRPAGNPRNMFDVLAEHRCGSPRWPPAFHAPSWRPDPPPPLPADAPAPF